MFEVVCVCGTITKVRAPSAGECIDCACGRKLTVPSLRELKACADRNQPAPATERLSTPLESTPARLPESYAFHVCGNVHPTGDISSVALHNYVDRIMDMVKVHVQSEIGIETGVDLGVELGVSIALFPHCRLLELQVLAGNLPTSVLSTLQGRLEGIPVPVVQSGPVAMLLYRRVNRDMSTIQQLGAFPSLAATIQEIGVVTALQQASGQVPTLAHASNANSKGWWNQLLQKWWPKRKQPKEETPPPTTPQQLHKEQCDFVEKAGHYAADITIESLGMEVRDKPDDLGYRVALALKYTEVEDWDKAIEAFTTALQRAPQFACLFDLRARANRLAGKNDAALGDYTQAIQTAPFEYLYYYSRAEIYTELEAWSAALSDLNEATLRAPFHPPVLYFRSQVKCELGDKEGAIQDLLECVRLDPNSGSGHAMLGWIYQSMNQEFQSKAIEHLTRSLELVPNAPLPLLHRSLAYLSENKFALALTDADLLVAISPDSGTAHGLRGRILQIEGEYEEAILECSKALELGFENSMVYLSRAISYASTEQNELAKSDCDAALQLDPDNPMACLLRGRLELQDGNLDTAMEAFLKARELAPGWEEPREELALVHRMKQNPEAAVEEQTKLIDANPERPANYVNRAFAFNQLGDFKRAAADFAKGIELDPENEQIYYLRGVFWIHRQEYELALADLDRVLSLVGDDDNARMQRAHTLLCLKRQEEAASEYAKLIAKYPDDPRAYSGRAYAFGLSGNDEAASRDLERSMELSPETSEETRVQAMVAKSVHLRDIDEYEPGIAIANDIIELAPDSHLGYQVRGGMHWYAEDYVEASDDYSKAIELSEDLPHLFSARGQVLCEMGEFEAAMLDLEKAVELSREAGENLTLAFSLSGRAALYSRMEKWDEAKRDFQESELLCPTNAWLYYHRALDCYRQGLTDQARMDLELAMKSDMPKLPARKRSRTRSLLEKLGEGF